MSARVEAREVTKRFGDHLALARFSVRIAPGEIFGLIGPNGAGKTTFLRILTGYWLPSSGDVLVDGTSVVAHPYAVRSQTGYVCEQPKLYADHAVETFLRMMGRIRGLRGPSLHQAVESAVERFGLGELRRTRIGVLSKGFRQRVSLAQALLHAPSLLVIDEPTVGLDPRQQIDLRRQIGALAGKHTVILCTHQLQEAEICCNRVALLDEGRLVRIASSEEMKQGGALEALFLQATQRVETGA